MSTVRATFYAQVEPTWASSWSPTGQRRLAGATVRKVTQNPPENPGCAVVVRLVVELPERAFLPLAPEAVIVINEDAIAVPVVVVPDQPQ